MDQNTWFGVGTAAVVLLFVFLVDGQKNPVEELKVQTMAIHDEAMVEMAEMNRLGRMLKRELAQQTTDTPRTDSIRATLRLMKKAEEDMYTWMRQYTDPVGRPTEEALRYLEEQKRLIGQNQEDIRRARDAARKLLEQR
jgi:hypothetical protein